MAIASDIRPSVLLRDTEPTKCISRFEFTTGIISISDSMISGKASINWRLGVSAVPTGRIRSSAIT
ncbi:uncharacterized protein METZ01_LOCUS333562, partial [marine metagenome]